MGKTVSDICVLGGYMYVLLENDWAKIAEESVER